MAYSTKPWRPLLLLGMSRADAPQYAIHARIDVTFLSSDRKRACAVFASFLASVKSLAPSLNVGRLVIDSLCSLTASKQLESAISTGQTLLDLLAALIVLEVVSFDEVLADFYTKLLTVATEPNSTDPKLLAAVLYSLQTLLSGTQDPLTLPEIVRRVLLTASVAVDMKCATQLTHAPRS